MRRLILLALFMILPGICFAGSGSFNWARLYRGVDRSDVYNQEPYPITLTARDISYWTPDGLLSTGDQVYPNIEDYWVIFNQVSLTAVVTQYNLYVKVYWASVNYIGETPSSWIQYAQATLVDGGTYYFGVKDLSPSEYQGLYIIYKWEIWENGSLKNSTQTVTVRLSANSEPTYTPTRTPTPTYTETPTPTFTFTPTQTFTFTPTRTPFPTGTVAPTTVPTNTFTPTATKTFTPTTTPIPTNTATSSPTSTKTFTPTFTYTSTPTGTRTPEPTGTNTFTPTFTYTPTFTSTPTFTFTPTFTATETSLPTATFTYTQTPAVIYTPTGMPSNTPTFTFTNTPTFTYTPTYTPTSTPFQWNDYIRIEKNYIARNSSMDIVDYVSNPSPIPTLAGYPYDFSWMPSVYNRFNNGDTYWLNYEYSYIVSFYLEGNSSNTSSDTVKTVIRLDVVDYVSKQTYNISSGSSFGMRYGVKLSLPRSLDNTYIYGRWTISLYNLSDELIASTYLDTNTIYLNPGSDWTPTPTYTPTHTPTYTPVRTPTYTPTPTITLSCLGYKGKDGLIYYVKKKVN